MILLDCAALAAFIAAGMSLALWLISPSLFDRARDLARVFGGIWVLLMTALLMFVLAMGGDLDASSNTLLQMWRLTD